MGAGGLDRGQLEERLGVGKSEGECVDACIQLRDASLQCWRTGAYDMLQKVSAARPAKAAAALDGVVLRASPLPLQGRL